jgi:hypothetical protein
MPARADVVFVQTTNLLQFQGAGVQYVVETTTGVLYCVFVDSASDLAFRKSSDGGLTWSAPVVIFTGTIIGVSVWYDRWSNISAGLIHMAYQDSGADDTLYRTINTESSDALSTQTTIFAGVSTATGGMVSITRAVGGNVYCRTTIDAGAEGGFFRLLNANVPNGAWDAARTIDETLATQDQIILLPDYDAADNQDIIAIFWDSTAEEISRKLYDDSGNSWSETSIATSMVDQTAATAFPHFAVAMDIANTQHILVAWSAVDTANADLRCWTIDASSITEKTNVVLNGTDDQGLCGVTLDTRTGYWWVFYGGNSDGSETFLTSINIYCKVSTDSGTTWGPERKMTTAAADITWLTVIPRLSVTRPVIWYHNDLTYKELAVNVPITQPHATHQMYGG